MTQHQLERELSLATGESIATIRSRGFSLVEPPELEPLVVDWEELYPSDVRLPVKRECRTRQAA